MGWAWSVGRVAGIPVRVHWTLVALLGVVALASGAGALGMLASAVLLFGSVVAHELAHALVARGFGIRTHDIVLSPLGGVARLDGTPASGRAEVLIALAGPAMSLAIAGAAWLALGFAPAAAAGVLGTLVWANAMLGVFNLVPAFPMDGGRVLRGLLHERIGPARATEIAAGLGRAVAIAMGLVGLFAANVSLVLIAMFVWIASGRERAFARALEARRRAEAAMPRAWDAFGREIPVELVDRPRAWPRRAWPPRVYSRPVVIRF
jgi:Zn-dependent protease